MCYIRGTGHTMPNHAIKKFNGYCTCPYCVYLCSMKLSCISNSANSNI